MSGERGRYEFLCQRDGRQAADEFMRSLIKAYRKTVIQRKTHTMYRRPLIEGYLSAKRILRDRGSHA